MSSIKRARLFVVCAAVVVLAGPSILLAQLSDLPIQAGLWETQVRMISGIANGQTRAARVCFSAGTTLGDYLTATNRGGASAECSATKAVTSAHEIAFDTACSGRTMTSKGHIEVELTDAEHFSGQSHTTVIGAGHGKPVTTTIDKRFSATFLASDCGDVKPLVVPGFHEK
jgi:hypothetical protein